MPPTPTPAGKRVFSCCHSFHCFVPTILGEIAAAAGIEDHGTVGQSPIGGSRVSQHWDLVDQANPGKHVLRNALADVLTLSPIWLPDVGIENFATLAVKHNPDVMVTVQQFWLPNDEFEPIYPLQTKKVVDHNATDLSQLRTAQRRYDQELESHLHDLNRKIGRDTLVPVPVGMAVLALRERIVAGKALGVTTQAELFRDSWGHPAAPVQVIASYCHFAVIYGRSPVGLAAPSQLADATHPAWDDKLNRLLQELAWEVVANNPACGVGRS